MLVSHKIALTVDSNRFPAGLPIPLDRRILPISLGNGTLVLPMPFVIDARSDLNLIPPYLFTDRCDVELRLGQLTFRPKSYEPVIPYISPPSSDSAMQDPTIMLISRDVFFSSLIDTGATRHHLNKATMKDLKLEQTKPVGRIWTDQFGFEDVFRVPLEIPGVGIINQDMFTSPLPYNIISGEQLLKVGLSLTFTNNGIRLSPKN